MWVLSTFINIKVVEEVIAKTVLWEHASYNVLYKTLVTFVTCSNLSRSKLLLTTGITRESQIDTVCPLVTSHLNLVGVDDDYIVTTVNVRSEAGFVLTSQKFGNLCAKTTKYLVCRINNNPLFLSCCLVC